MAVPAVHQLHLAGHTIDWVCGPTVLPLLQLYPWINPILADEAALLTGSPLARVGALCRLWSKTLGPAYDLVAVLYYSAAYRVFALPLRGKRKLMLSHAHRDFRLLPGRHHTDEFARILLGRPDDVCTSPLAPVLPPALPASPLPRRPGTYRIALAPGGAKNLLREDVLRRWPVENYVTLARLLLQAGHQVVLIGGPGDTWIFPYFAGLEVTDCIGRHSLPQTLALLDDSDILVTHDSGPLHLGGLTGAGIIAVFGPTDPRGRLPQRPGTLAIWGGEGFPCRPCYDGHDYAACRHNACMDQVTPGRVLEQTEAMLEQRRGGTAHSPTILTPPSTVGSTSLL